MASKTTFSLPLGDVHALNKPLPVNDVVGFHASTVSLTPDPNGDNTSLNLLSGDGDYLIHISFRRSTGTIVLNSRYAASGWGTEEYIDWVGTFTDGQPATVSVRDNAHTFTISIDGKERHLYHKRINLPTQAVAYRKNAAMTTAIFGSAIAVQITSTSPPPDSYESAYFHLTIADVEEESNKQPFDIIVIGSGIGGGVLANTLLEKNRRVMESGFNDKSTPAPADPRWRGPILVGNTKAPTPLRILVLERGHLIFHTHSMNGPRPSNSGTTSQGNDLFFNLFKHQWDADEETKKIWVGGAVYTLGGRGSVWGLFAPRISLDTLNANFPPEIRDTLLAEYYRKAEGVMNVEYPTTKPPHQALIDRLNLKLDPDLPSTQWEWGRIASEFRDPKNYDFAAGAYSPIDTLLEAAMNDPTGEKDPYFRTVLNAPVARLEPEPVANQLSSVTHVVVKDGDRERKIACKNAVVCAGSIESAAVLLRSVNGDITKFGTDFKTDFGHVTDHLILAVAKPFFYRNMEDRDVIGGMKLQTDIQFNIVKNGKVVDDTVALANISLDTVSFLPRDDVSDGLLPMLVIAYIIPSALVQTNKVELNSQKDPRIHVTWEDIPYLEDKEKVLKDFAVDIMNKMVDVLDVRFADRNEAGYQPLLHKITVDDIQLNKAGAGVVAHELGTIPMPNASGSHGLLDTNLHMKYGWDNVSVCDLSIFPYSAAANPTLTLAALALRLADNLYPDPKYAPMTAYNLTGDSVVVNMTTSKPASKKFGPELPVTIPSGGSATWQIEEREAMSIYSSESATSYDLQMVYPGTNAMIVNSPPAADD